jgi:hypothetical protein
MSGTLRDSTDASEPISTVQIQLVEAVSAPLPGAIVRHKELPCGLRWGWIQRPPSSLQEETESSRADDV